MPNSEQFDRLEGRFDDLSAKIDKNHSEVTQAIHNVELKVTKHEQNFNILKYLIPTGSFLGLISFIRGLWGN